MTGYYTSLKSRVPSSFFVATTSSQRYLLVVSPTGVLSPDSVGEMNKATNR